MLASFSSNAEKYTLSVCQQDSPCRREAEQFIAARFSDKLDATITHFMPTLLVVRDRQGAIAAACGVRSGEENPLFLENYLNEAIEHAIVQRAQLDVTQVVRSDIVEIGNLASVNFSASRFLFQALFDYCDQHRFVWVVFTSCQRLLTAFKHLGLSLVKLADAHASRLSVNAGAWGTYYSDTPVVMAGRLQSAKQVFAHGHVTGIEVLHV